MYKAVISFLCVTQGGFSKFKSKEIKHQVNSFQKIFLMNSQALVLVLTYIDRKSQSNFTFGRVIHHKYSA